MSTQGNAALVRRLVDEVISKGYLSVIDELISQQYVYHAPGMEVRGPEEMRGVFTMLRTAFPDWHETLEDSVAEGDTVVFRVTGRGTHQGEFRGIPATGKQVSMSGIDMVRLEGSQIVEHWALFDQLGMMQQLGVIPKAV